MDYDVLFSQISEHCAQLLAIDTAQVTGVSNFFELGGNSVKALQFCLNLEAALPQLFETDGIDLSLIASQPNMQCFVNALLDNKANVVVIEGEL
jgi:hypothetical protein